MILLLKSGQVDVICNNWSAGANPNGRVNLLAHGGTIGLTMDMEEFNRQLAGKIGKGMPVWNLRDFCEDPKDTHERLSLGG